MSNHHYYYGRGKPRWRNGYPYTLKSRLSSEIHDDLGVAGGEIHAGAGAWTASGTLASAGTRTRPGAGAFTADGTNSIGATLTKGGAATLSASATAALAGYLTKAGASALTADGTISIAGTATLGGAAAWTADATINIVPDAIPANDNTTLSLISIVRKRSRAIPFPLGGSLDTKDSSLLLFNYYDLTYNSTSWNVNGITSFSSINGITSFTNIT